MRFLFNDSDFPAVDSADKDGLLAIGGDLSVSRLIRAYQNGIFPWFDDDDPILWWAPPKRMVLFWNELKISKSMRNILNRQQFRVSFNQSFEAVISNCRTVSRVDQGQCDTWITKDMKKAYIDLHKQAYAKSVEVWQNDDLVGGLYGVDLGHIFCGESMFSLVSNASKVAFIALCGRLKSENYTLLDCQLYNPHLESLGAREISRAEYMKYLSKGKKE